MKVGQYHFLFLIWSVFSLLSFGTLQPTMCCFPIPCIPFFWLSQLMNEETYEMPAPTLNIPNIKVGTTTSKKITQWQVCRICCFSRFSALMKCQYPTQRKKKMVGLVFLPKKKYVCNEKFPFVLRWFWIDKGYMAKKDASTHPINQKGSIWDAYGNENLPLVFANNKVPVPKLHTKR